MILTSMYTANLTAHLTLDRAVSSIKNFDDLLNGQTDYKWGVILDRNLQIMMSNHEEKKYNNIVNRGKNVENLDEAIGNVTKGGYVFIDESSVVTYNFREDCLAEIVKTGKFNNQWAFGTQVNSPYAALINSMFLQYRERGWFTIKFDEWYSNAEGLTVCPSSLGSDTKFGLSVLSGLFLILGVGAFLSFVTVFLEILYVARQDSIEHGRSVWECLKERVKFKCQEVREEWFDRGNGKADDYHGSNGHGLNGKSDVLTINSILPNVSV